MKRIGVTCSYPELPRAESDQVRMQAYLDAIATAGAQGEMLWLPTEGDLEAQADAVAARLDGLIISGGADLPPELYGEEPRGDADLDVVTPARPAWEAALLPRMMAQGKPVLGICYGCQFLNVHQGGGLIQDIPTEWPNPIAHGGNVIHGVHLQGDSRLHRIIGEDRFEVCSYHHQAIARVAEGGAVTSWAPDNTPESIEFAQEKFVIGVQWHPERTPDSSATRKLMAALVAACD